MKSGWRSLGESVIPEMPILVLLLGVSLLLLWRGGVGICEVRSRLQFCLLQSLTFLEAVADPRGGFKEESHQVAKIEISRLLITRVQYSFSSYTVVLVCPADGGTLFLLTRETTTSYIKIICFKLYVM